MKMLKEQYGGKVPDDFDALLKLPGVGRKSANLIMGDVFGKPAIVTDTHCIRLVGNGLVKDIKEPKKERWNCGRSFHRKRGMISVTDWWSMAGMSVQHGQIRIVTAVC